MDPLPTRSAAGRAALYAAALPLFFLAVSLALAPPASRRDGAAAARAGFEPSPPRGRLLVVMLDSLQYRDMFGPEMPYISSLRPRGAWGVSEVVSAPLSVAGTHAVFSGYVTGPSSIFEDFTPAPSPRDNLFRRVAAAGRRGRVFGRLPHLLYSGDTGAAVYKPSGLLFSQYRELGDHVFGQARASLAAGGWDAAAVAFYGLDHAAHLETPLSPAYREMLRRTDGWVRGLTALAGPLDTVLITSEHGVDDNGFHTGLTPATLGTGFVIWGPSIKKGGPLRVAQPDWAATLSVLAGVSPFYESPGLPALELLALPREKARQLSEAFAAGYGTAGELTPAELRALQAGDLRRRRSAGRVALVALLLTLSAALLAAAGLPAGREPRTAIAAAGGAAAVLLGSWALAASGEPAAVAARWPFSANFILSHLPGVAALLAAAAAAALPLRRRLANAGLADALAAAAVTAVSAAVFASGEPYHLLCWLVAAGPLAAWGATGRKGWLVAAAAFAAGLAVRRLTYYNAIAPLHLPDRWVFCAAVAVAALAWARLNGAPRRGLAMAALGLLPAVACAALPAGVEARALLLLLCLAPLAAAARACSPVAAPLAAAWAVCFLLGTSGSLELLSHFFLLPVFAGLWSASKGQPAWRAGVAAGTGFWMMYLLPGNDFSLTLYALRDKYILGSALGGSIGVTVAVVAARIMLPCAVLLWGLQRGLPAREAWRLPSAMLLPAVCGAALLLGAVVLRPGAAVTWRETVNLVVLSSFVAATALSFMAAMAARAAGGRSA